MKEKIFLDPDLFEFLTSRGCHFDACLEKLSALQDFQFVTDVKALQEVVYRYHLIGETAVGYEKAMALRKCIEIYDIAEEEIQTQETLLERYPNVKPRELLHVAVMLNHQVFRIACSPQSTYGEVEDISVKNIISNFCPL